MFILSAIMLAIIQASWVCTYHCPNGGIGATALGEIKYKCRFNRHESLVGKALA